MAKNKKLPDNQITVYQTPDGEVNIEVMYADENLWMPQKRIAELFDVDHSVVTKHLKNIFLDKELEKDTVCANFAHTAEDGKMRLTDCANTKTVFRLIQSIPSKKAEPLKQWLAQVGYEGMEEIQNPELAQKRMKKLYRAKGYSDYYHKLPYGH